LVWICGAVFIARFYLTHRGGDDQQAVRERAHSPQPLDENRAFHCEGTHQIAQVLALDDAGFFETAHAVVAQRKRFLLDACEPSLKSRERKWILFTSIDDDDRFGRVELRVSALGNDWERGMRHRQSGHLPFERRSNERASSSHQ